MYQGYKSVKEGYKSMKKILIRVVIAVVVILVAMFICVKPIKGSIPASEPAHVVTQTISK